MEALATTVPLRPPEQVMRLARMGVSFPHRLSFLRIVLRRLCAERPRIERTLWEIDDRGEGRAVFTLRYGGHRYSLVCFGHDLPDEARTDRVIATAWDATFTLFDGVPTADDLDRLAANVPRQEAGRLTERELVLCRANRSVRAFSSTVAALAAGHQPDAELVRRTGYLMRTTAVYGNGKFGLADRSLYCHRPGLDTPFAAEMLCVWLIRHFTHALVEHLSGGRLAPAIARHLGIGNATGLGMAPFLGSHPVLMHNWVETRETALGRVRALETISSESVETMLALAERAAAHLDEWRVPDPLAEAANETTRAEWAALRARLPGILDAPRPVDRLIAATADCSLQTQELAVSLALEPFGHVVDDLAASLADDVGEPDMLPADTASLAELIARDWGWALAIDFTDPERTARFWYVSEEKLEPRIGWRHEEPGAEWETPLDIARATAALAKALPPTPEPLDAFLIRHPEHLRAARRVATLAAHPYSEIRDNLIDARVRPIDLLRFKLAFFGAAKFDPKSDLWTRINLYQGAPVASGLADGDDSWLQVLR